MEQHQNRDPDTTAPVPLTSDVVFKYVFGGDQLAEGDLYTRLRPVVSVNFLNFTVFPAETDAPLHTVFLPACRNAPKVEPLQDMVLHFLDLPMFAARFADTSVTPPSTALERWLYYIVRRGAHRAMEDPIMKKILEESPDIAAAERRYGTFIADEQLRSRMDARDKFIRTNAQLLHDAKEEGWETGREEGHMEGRKEGHAAGVRDTARGMKEKGITVETIAEITGLSAGDIAEL